MWQTANAELISESVKNKAKMWVYGKASDGDFVKLVKELDRYGLKVPKFDKVDTYILPSYGDTVFVRISGRTADYTNKSPVVVVFSDPNGVRTEYTSSLLQGGAYFTLFPLSFSSTPGLYTVRVYHNGVELDSSSFFVKRPDSIPPWVKNVTKLWVEQKISEQEFVHFVQYLVDKKIIKFDGVILKNPEMVVMVDGYKAVRQGTAQDIIATVRDDAGPIEGATVFVRVENYNKDVLWEFHGITDHAGKYRVSWEIRDVNDLETLIAFIDVTDGIHSRTEKFVFDVYCICAQINCKCRN